MWITAVTATAVTPGAGRLASVPNGATSTTAMSTCIPSVSVALSWSLFSSAWKFAITGNSCVAAWLRSTSTPISLPTTKSPLVVLSAAENPTGVRFSKVGGAASTPRHMTASSKTVVVGRIRGMAGAYFTKSILRVCLNSGVSNTEM